MTAWRAAALLAGAVVAGCASKPEPQPVRTTVPVPRPVPKPPSKPAWQARRVVADAATTPQGRVHTVKPGETGIAIARAYGVPWDRVIPLNSLKSPYVLEVGDKLLLPSARQVAAQSPEDRAKAFSLDIDDIITGGEPAAAVRPKAVTPRITPQPRPATSVAIANGPSFRWPVEGRVLSSFGAKPGGRFNDGVNLRALAGAPVRAAGDGVIAYAGDAIPGFGNLVLIKHPGGWVTAYGHAEAVLVTRGTKVTQGDVIARAGATGAVTEPQVHFEVRRGRTPVDPAKVVGR